MKKIILFLFLFPAVVFLHSGCEKGAKIEEPVVEELIEEEEPPIESDENGNLAIIGVSQCPLPIAPGSFFAGRGFVVHIINTSDTVTTYTLPLPVAKQIVRSVPGMQMRDINFFPEDKILKINLPYRFASEKENKYEICLAFMGNGTLYSKYNERQIIIEESSSK